MIKGTSFVFAFCLRIEVIRKPTGPDGTRGFAQPRALRSLSSQLLDHAQFPDKVQAFTPSDGGSVFEDLVANICE